MTVPTDLIVIILSVFIVAGILLYNASKNLGIQSFIIIYGDRPVYDNPELTEFLSSIALNIIIFVGGYNTSYPSIKCAY